MELLCLEPHIYQDLHCELGQVYEFDDLTAGRLLRDYGVGNRYGHIPHFEAAEPGDKLRSLKRDEPEGAAPKDEASRGKDEPQGHKDEPARGKDDEPEGRRERGR